MFQWPVLQLQYPTFVLLLLFKNVYMCSLLFNNCYIISTRIIFIFCSHFLSVTNCLHLLCQGFTLFTSGLCYTLRTPTFIYTFINFCPIFDLSHLSFFKSKLHPLLFVSLFFLRMIYLCFSLHSGLLKVILLPSIFLFFICVFVICNILPKAHALVLTKTKPGLSQTSYIRSF